MATSLLATIYNSVSLGNVLLLLVLLFIVHYLMVLYEFRNMPPGPRLTTLPVLGNIFSLDSRAEKVKGQYAEHTQWIPNDFVALFLIFFGGPSLCHFY